MSYDPNDLHGVLAPLILHTRSVPGRDTAGPEGPAVSEPTSYS